MMLLDTHIWLRWLLPTDPLPSELITQIEYSDKVFISAMSCWEAVMLSQRRRIALSVPIEHWLSKATKDSGIEILPVTGDISYLAAMLTEHHKDPVDRIIITTAIHHLIPLISYERKFPSYQELGTLLTQ